MTALIEKLRQRQTAAAQERQADIEDAWKHYRKLLARADAPQKTDADELVELANVLKLSPEEIEQDLKTLDRARAFVGTLKTTDPVQLAKDKHASVSDFELSAAWRKAQREAGMARVRVESGISMGQNAAYELEKMVARDHDLLGPEIEAALDQFNRQVAEAAKIEPHPHRRVKITVEVVTDEPTPEAVTEPAGGATV